MEAGQNRRVAGARAGGLSELATGPVVRGPTRIDMFFGRFRRAESDGDVDEREPVTHEQPENQQHCGHQHESEAQQDQQEITFLTPESDRRLRILGSAP